MYQVVGIFTVGIRHQVDGLVHAVDALLAVALEEEVLAHRDVRQGQIVVVARLLGQVAQQLQPLVLLDLVAGKLAGRAEAVKHVQPLNNVGLSLLVPNS